MPPKHRGSKRGKGGKGGGNVSNRLFSQSTVTVPFRGIPFVITQTTSGTGGISTENSGSSLSSTSLVNIDPFNFGARCSLIADQFLEYRFKSVTFKYIPRYTASGVAPTPGGATSTPSYANRNFVWGFVEDPALAGALSYQIFMEYGGTPGNTTKKSSIRLRGGTLSKWRFTSTTASSPTAIDLRMVAPAQMRFYFDDTSTTAAATYGYIVYDAVIEFRGAANNAAIIGVTETPTRKISTDEDKKVEDSPVLVGAPAKLAPKPITNQKSGPVESSEEKALEEAIHNSKWPVPWLSTIGTITARGRQI